MVFIFFFINLSYFLINNINFIVLFFIIQIITMVLFASNIISEKYETKNLRALIILLIFVVYISFLVFKKHSVFLALAIINIYAGGIVVFTLFTFYF